MRKLLWLSVLLVVGTAFGQTTHSVTATWTASPDAAANPTLTYNIYRATSDCTAPNLQLLAVVGPGVLTFKDTTVAASTTYCYGITAELNGLESTPVNGVAVIPANPKPPQSPSNLNLKVGP